jgi:hypothetical protein
MSHSITETERLVKALERSAVDRDDPNRQNVLVSGNRLVVRVPDYDEENLGQLDNLGKYLRWGATVLGMKDPEVRTLKDPALGKSIPLPSRIERMMDNTIAALSLPPSESGEKAEFKTGFKANLVELLAAVQLMRRYTGVVQKGTAPKGHKSVQISLEDLRNSINSRSGLKEHGIIPFTAIYVKAIFNELTKPNSKRFPGKWLHSLKVTNGVKNNIGVIYKLGYEAKVANAQKVLNVLKTGVRTKDSAKKKGPNGKVTEPKRLSNETQELFTLDEKSNPDGISHRDFRLGALLLLPLIDPKDAKSPKDQISKDPLTVRDKKVLNFYSKNREIVDALNLAYATKAAVGKKNSKATVLGYKSAKYHAVRLSANCEWMDASGKTYTRLTEVPEHIRTFLLKILRRKLSEGDDSSSEEGEQEMETASEKRTPEKE